MVCLEYLEEVYRDRPLLPGAPGERARLRFWAVYANEKIIPHYYRLLMSQDTGGRERARAGLVDSRLGVCGCSLIASVLQAASAIPNSDKIELFQRFTRLPLP